MHRFRRVAALWNWLPAFRAVAETQHLRRAGDLLCVSPSALSRSIHLLEDAIGGPLFVRAGRNLRLTALGDELLLVVRDSMRRLDDALRDVSRWDGWPLAVAAPDLITRRLLVAAIAASARGAA